MTAVDERGRARRLSPLTVVLGAARETTALLLAGAAGLAVGGLTTGVYFALAGVTLGLVHHAVRWLTFTYRVYDDRIVLRRQLIGRSTKTIPLERVRGVDVSAGPVHRLFRLAVVHIDAAAGGGGADEAVLNAISQDETTRLRDELLGGRGGGAPPAAAGANGARAANGENGADVADVADVAYDRVLAEPMPDGAMPIEAVAVDLVRARRRWYMYAPLSGAYLLTPFALIGSVLGGVYNLGDDLGLITERRVESFGRQVSGLPLVVGVVALAMVVLVLPVVSVVVFALFNWDFTLKSRAGAIVAERGLLTRRSVSLERRRIRGVELLANPMERIAGVVRLRALVTGLADAAHRGTLLPVSPNQVAEDIAGRVLGAPPASVPAPLVGHPKAARVRRIVRAVVPPLLAAGLAGLAGQAWAVATCLALAVLAVPLGLDRYRQLGHALDDLHLAVRSGSLRRRHVIVERRAVVGWQVRQTVFQRRLGLATLVAAVGAGDGEVTAIDMAAADAVALARLATPDWVVPFLDSAGA
ncbi:MAG TPA: PH domain-containing protein [Streptosporangiaceae bacterium]|nr:PH domain-containing protein [Streptosporangiaceae bacterium]